jgi:hypothetical protein
MFYLQYFQFATLAMMQMLAILQCILMPHLAHANATSARCCMYYKATSGACCYDVRSSLCIMMPLLALAVFDVRSSLCIIMPLLALAMYAHRFVVL